MKHLTRLFLVLIAIALCFTSAAAQAPVNACQVDLLVAHVRARGKLARVGNALAFIEEPALGRSFSIDRSNIVNTNEYAGVFSVYTRSPVRYQDVRERHFTFKFSSNNCFEIARWLQQRSTAAPRPRSATYYSEPREGGYYYREPSYSRSYARPVIRRVFGAKQQRSWRPDIDGRLSITERAIEFEPYSGDRRVHAWDLKDIRQIERDGPHKLKIKPFGEDEYSFRIRDRAGLSTTTFRNLERIIYGGYYGR